MNENIRAKVVILGDTMVGKTSLIVKHVNNDFKIHKPTISASFLSLKKTLANQKILQIDFWDTAGQENYRSMTNIYCRDADVGIIVFDLTNEKSFQNLGSWIEYLKNFNEVPFIICGNKSDLPKREISIEKAYEFANSIDVNYFDTSAFTGFGLDECFEAVENIIFESLKLNDNNNENDKVNLVEVEKKTKKCCN